MLTETKLDKSEVPSERQYTHKSFELVFKKFCGQYAARLEAFTGRPTGKDKGFMGLHPDATWRQIGQRLDEVGRVMGETPRWQDDQEEVSMLEAVLLSTRYLAWNAVMGGITERYVDKLKENIEQETSKNGGQGNVKRLMYEKARGLSILLAQNHALKDYFDSGLARTLGNDSPEAMQRLLSGTPYARPEQTSAVVKGISLEIATKRHLEGAVVSDRLADSRVAYGSNEEDSRGGDLVLMHGDEIFFVDVKSSMPKKFSNGEESTPEDYERGYKWLDSDSADAQEHKVVVWAYEAKRVASGEFRLTDERLAQNLELVASSISV